MTTMTNDIADIAAEAQAEVMNQEPQTHEVIITLDGQDQRIPMESLGVDISSPDADVLAAVRGIIDEASSIDDQYGNPSFAVRRATNSDTIYVYPKPVAG